MQSIANTRPFPISTEYWHSHRHPFRPLEQHQWLVIVLQELKVLSQPPIVNSDMAGDLLDLNDIDLAAGKPSLKPGRGIPTLPCHSDLHDFCPLDWAMIQMGLTQDRGNCTVEVVCLYNRKTGEGIAVVVFHNAAAADGFRSADGILGIGNDIAKTADSGLPACHQRLTFHSWRLPP